MVSVLPHEVRETGQDDEKCRKYLQSVDSESAPGRIVPLVHEMMAEKFNGIVDDYDWTFCQIQYNFMDIEYQAGTRGLQYAAKKGLAVVIMEPLRGGQLTAKIPKSVNELWESAIARRTPADWALQWIWDHAEVSVLLSGMSTMEQVIENLDSADRAEAGTLSKEELTLIDKVREEYRRISPIPCTNCKYWNYQN